MVSGQAPRRCSPFPLEINQDVQRASTHHDSSSAEAMRCSLYLPAQAAAESEVTIVQWYVGEGDVFERGQPLAEVDSAKSVFDFEAPCHGRVVRLLHEAGDSFELSEPVVEIETDDPAMRDWIPPAAAQSEPTGQDQPASASREMHPSTVTRDVSAHEARLSVGLRAVAGYLPQRVVTNEELAARFPDIDAAYIRKVTGMDSRHWARDDESPLDMAATVARAALARSGLPTEKIGALIVATATPHRAMPSTACSLQAELGLGPVPSFDLNAACSGWLYALGVAKGLILADTADHVLIVGTERHSGLLDPNDSSTLFLFGDGAGAAIVSAIGEGHGADVQHGGGGTADNTHPSPLTPHSSAHPSASCHEVHDILLWADGTGSELARRMQPGYLAAESSRSDASDSSTIDPWIRLEGAPMFRRATETFAQLIRESLRRSGWQPDELRWVIPHQANGRILRAAARQSGVGVDRFFINLDHVGNTSSASIPLALVELEPQLRPGDKVIFCSVGAGLTGAAVALKW